MSPSVRKPIVAVAAAFLSLVCVVGGPERTAEAGPLAVVGGESLDVKAERLDIDINGGTALLEGKVKATLGGLTVWCPKVELTYDKAPSVKWAKGSGGVTAKMKGITAKASTVEVDVTKRQVKLQGGVRLSRGKGWIRAGSATIDMKTKKVSLRDVKGSIPVEPPKR